LSPPIRGVNRGDAGLGSSPVAAASADPFRGASVPGSAKTKRYGGDGDPGRVVDIEPDEGIADAAAFSSRASAVLILGR